MKIKQCSICLEKVPKPTHLNLNCECRYKVHYSCYMRWWKTKIVSFVMKLVINPLVGKNGVDKID